MEEPKVEKLDAKEYASIVNVLEQHIVVFLELAEKVEIEVDSDDILEVIDKAIFHADGLADEPLKSDDPKEHFLESMYEELADARQNLFEKKKNEAEIEEYVPLDTELWKECLAHLRTKVITMLMEDDADTATSDEFRHIEEFQNIDELDNLEIE